MKKLLSKFFRVALEGATTDGRKITRQEISQMAKNYDPKKYGARIWLEHFRGLFPDSAFAALGDVVAVKTAEENGKLGLYAQIAPTPALVEMNQKRQKIYTSIEIAPEFSDTGEAYLMGLGVTDSPASLGTEVLTFSANATHSIFSDRKQHKDNLIVEALESNLEFTDTQESDSPVEGTSTLLSRVKELFTGQKKEGDQRFNDVDAAVLAIAESHQAALDKSSQQQEALTTLKAAHEALLEKFNALQTKLEGEPDPKHKFRTVATGGNGEEVTDC